MGYAYTPTYYSGLQDTIASLCKSILPFSFRPGRRAAPRRGAQVAAGLLPPHPPPLRSPPRGHRTGLQRRVLPRFHARLAHCCAARPAGHPPRQAPLPPGALVREVHLGGGVQLAALGVVIECPDTDVGGCMAAPASSSVEEWSEIDLRDPPPSAAASDKTKHKAFIPPWKSRGKKVHDTNSTLRPPLAQVDQNHTKNASVLMAESSPSEAMPSVKAEKGKRRHLTAMFHDGGESKEPAVEEGNVEKETLKGRKKSSWVFDGLKKWKKAGGDGNEG